MKKVLMMIVLAAMTATTWADEVVTPPAGLSTEPYVAILTTSGGATYYQNAKLGFYGENEVYIQGLAFNGVPDSWVKGTFPAEYMGVFLSIPKTFLGSVPGFGGNTYNYYFNETSFIYEASTKQFKAPAGYSITGGIGTETYNTATLKRLVEKEATPADPMLEFKPSINGSTYVTDMTIPLLDTNGDPMVSDKLSYIFYIVKNNVQSELTFTKDKYKKLTEDMTEIPYNFTDKYDIDNYEIWMNQGLIELLSWTKLGLQTIYRGGGVEHRSNIVWFDMEAYWKGTSGIEDVKTGKANENNVFYNLSGQRVDNPTKGLYIVNGRKVIVK